MPTPAITETMPSEVKRLIHDMREAGGVPTAQLAILALDTITSATVTRNARHGRDSLYSGWSADLWDVVRSDGSRDSFVVAGESGGDGAIMDIYRTVEEYDRAVRAGKAGPVQ